MTLTVAAGFCVARGTVVATIYVKGTSRLPLAMAIVLRAYPLLHEWPEQSVSEEHVAAIKKIMYDVS